MRRVVFRKGNQREFFDLAILRTDSPSLRGLLQFGIEVPYSTLKNYYNGLRLLPEDLFLDLCEISRIEVSSLGVSYSEGNWGQVIGGKNGKRRKT